MKVLPRNPFLASATINVLRREVITNRVISIDENVSKITSSNIDYTEIEADEFVRVFKVSRQIGLIKELSAPGCRMLLYVQAKLKSGCDYINLKRDKVATDLEASESSIGYGIQNLIDCGVLCKKSQSEYWINPLILFNGNRKQYFLDNAPDHIHYIKDKTPVVINLTDYVKKKEDIIV